MSPLRKTEKRGPFCKNKTPLRRIESFSNSTFYGAIVSNTQYSTYGYLIYSDNTNFYFLKIIACKRTWICKHSLRRYRQSFSQGCIMYRTQGLFRIIFLNAVYLLAYYYSNK